MNYFLKFITVLCLINLINGRTILDKNPQIVSMDVTRESDTHIKFTIEVKDDDTKFAVGFGYNYYPSDVVVCVSGSCKDSYVKGIENDPQEDPLNNYYDIQDDSDSSVGESFSNNVYTFTKEVESTDIYDILVYNDDPNMNLIWMYYYEGDLYQGKLPIYGLDVGIDRRYGEPQQEEDIISSALKVKVEEGFLNQDMYQIWTITVSQTSTKWALVGVGKYDNGFPPKIYGDCIFIEEEGNGFTAYDGWAEGNSNPACRNDFSPNDDRNSTPEFNNVELISYETSGLDMIFKVKRLLKYDRWDFRVENGQNQLFAAYGTGNQKSISNADGVFSKMVNLLIEQTEISVVSQQSDLVKDDTNVIMKKVSNQYLDTNNIKLWFDIATVNDVRYYHGRVQKEGDGWFCIGISKETITDAVCCQFVDPNYQCFDCFVEGQNQPIQKDSDIGGSNDIIDVIGNKDDPGTGTITYLFEFKKKVSTDDPFDFTVYPDDDSVAYKLTVINSADTSWDFTIVNAPNIDDVDDLDDIPTGEYVHEEDEPEFDWLELMNDVYVYFQEGNDSGTDYQYITVDLPSTQTGWVAIGIGKKKASNYVGDVIVIYQQASAWTVADGWVNGNSVKLDTALTPAGNNDLTFIFRDTVTDSTRIVLTVRKQKNGDQWDYTFKKGNNDIFIALGSSPSASFPLDLSTQTSSSNSLKMNLKITEISNPVNNPQPNTNPFPEIDLENSPEDQDTNYDPVDEVYEDTQGEEDKAINYLVNGFMIIIIFFILI